MTFDPDAYLASAEASSAPSGPAIPPEAAEFQASLRPRYAPLRGEVAPELAEAMTPNAASAAGSGFAQGATLGFADEAMAAAHALTQGHGGSISGTYKAERDRLRREDREAREAHPYAFGAGAVAGGLATAAVPGGATLGIAGKGLVAAVERGAVAGALSGLGASEKDDLKGLALDTLKGAGLGALVGGAVHGAGSAVGALAAGAEGRIAQRELADLAERGGGTIKAKLAQKAEDVIATSRQFGLQKVIRNPAEMVEKVADAKNTVGNRIGDIFAEVDKSTGGVPITKLMRELHKVEQEYAANPATRAIARKIGDQIEEVRATWQNTNVVNSVARIPLDAINKLKGAMQEGAFASAEIAPRAGIRAARDAAGAVKSVIDEHVASAGKHLADELDGLNRQYSALSLIGKAAQKRADAATMGGSGIGKARTAAALGSLAYGNVPAAAAIAFGPQVSRAAINAGDQALAALVRAAQSGARAPEIIAQGAKMGLPRTVVQSIAARFAQPEMAGATP